VRDVWGTAVELGSTNPQAGVLLRGLGTGCRPVEETDANGFAFIRICPGKFRMGSPESESDAYANERPAHEVTLSEFWLGKYEVTNRQFRQLAPRYREEDDLPATRVSWEEAKAFCEHYGYRLPTEAEWEYACRAGTTTRWSFGDDAVQLGKYAWFSENSLGHLHAVGTREPNSWGLHDMYGNAWEWVADRYGPYRGQVEADPTGPEEGDLRVLRGGSFDLNGPGYLRSASRLKFEPSNRFENFGFRCGRGSRRQP
jgi:formylglycine-generating enzyme required for sulfatase activity